MTEQVAAEAAPAETTAEETGPAGGAGEAEAAAESGAPAAEAAVEIPKQQSADVVADSEAGEGARR
ncbi:gliding motility protein [Streptomyces sp. NPDC096136]|uniref:gliding motility protein n=1 Tax=Streptomyces sp. NPDC096136 TaxID=3366076 RepID=UPI0037FFE6EC